MELEWIGAMESDVKMEVSRKTMLVCILHAPHIIENLHTPSSSSSSSSLRTMSSTPITPARALRSTPARSLRSTPACRVSVVPNTTQHVQTPSHRFRNTPARAQRTLSQIHETPGPDAELRSTSSRRRRSPSIVAMDEHPARRRRIEAPASHEVVPKTSSRVWSYFAEASVDSRGKVCMHLSVAPRTH